MEIVVNVVQNAQTLNKNLEATCSYARKIIERNKNSNL